MGKFAAYRKMELGGPPPGKRPIMQQDATKMIRTPINPGPSNETKQYLTWLTKRSSKNQSDAFNSLRQENGNPDIKMINGRSNYTFYNNTMNVDTGGHNGPPIHSALSELAHAKQYQDHPISFPLSKIKDGVINIFKDEYQNPNSLEYQAHTIIQPQLQTKYQGRVDLNEAVGTSLEGDKDFTKAAYQPIKYNNGGVMKKQQDKPVVGKFARMRKMEGGGYPDPNMMQTTGQPTWLQKNGDTLATGAQFASAGINAIDPQDKYGVQSNVGALGSGALSGAATGYKTAGLIGAGVGAVIGGVTGLLGNKKKNREKQDTIARNTTTQLQQTQAMGEANIAADPSLKYGRMTASYYRFGGTMKGTLPAGPRTTKPIAAVQAKPRLMPNIAEVPGRQISRMSNGGALRFASSKFYKGTKPLKTQLHEMEDGGGIHINPANKGKFNATKEATGKSTEELTHSSNPITKKRAVFAQNAAKWNHKANGGTIEPLSSEDVKVNGPSHDAGGVKFPSKGVELEGGETVNDNFVFSKKLGFAKPAEKIARALGKVEARPDNPINVSTANALKRKTEILKGQQEATKAAMGIPNEFEQNELERKDTGGPIKPGGPARLKLPVTSIDFSKPLFPGVQPDDYIGRNAATFGAVNGVTALPGGGSVTNLRASSDKMNGTSNTFYSARNQARGKAIDTIPHTNFKFGGKVKQVSNAGGAFADHNGQQIYATGGKIKKMDDGGRVKFPLPPVSLDSTIPSIPELNIPDSQIPAFPVPNIPPGITPQTSSNSKGKFNVGDTVRNIADKASPFLSNFINATQKLPLPPTPILNPEITPSLVDYSASRNEAVRSTRSADAMARENLNSGAAVSATKAANLAQQQRSIAQINEAENNTNAGIRNSASAQNAQIKAGNTALQNNYNNELVSRQIKGQQLKSQNFANIEEKVQGMARDKKLFDLEDQKAMLGWLQNNDSGAGYDAVRGIFAKHLSPESLKQMDDQIAKQRKERADDRAETVKMGKLQLDYLKRKGIITDNPYDLLGNGVSAVNSAKDEQADSKTRIKKKE